MIHDAMLHLGLASSLMHSCLSICLSIASSHCPLCFLTVFKKELDMKSNTFPIFPNLDKLKIYGLVSKLFWPVFSQNFYCKKHSTAWSNDVNTNN